MFERFIVATDLSPASFAVVNCLSGLTAFGARQCLLLQCLDFHEATSAALSYTTDALEGILRQQQEALERQGFTVEGRIVPGFAKRELNRIAAEEAYDLLVVGSHGQSMIAEAMLGGIASAVIHSARRPVLVVRLAQAPESGEVCVTPVQCDLGAHILFPTDFSENADHAFGYVEQLAAAGVRRVTLLHVQDQSRIDPDLSDRVAEFDEIDRARLEKMADVLRRAGPVMVEIELRHGAPLREALAVIRERDVHLVVMGSQGRGYLAEVFLGSLSHQVARHAPAPVLLIPAVREG